MQSNRCQYRFRSSSSSFRPTATEPSAAPLALPVPALAPGPNAVAPIPLAIACVPNAALEVPLA